MEEEEEEFELLASQAVETILPAVYSVRASRSVREVWNPINTNQQNNPQRELFHHRPTSSRLHTPPRNLPTKQPTQTRVLLRQKNCCTSRSFNVKERY